MKKIFKIIGICIIVLFVLFCGLIFVQDNILYLNELYVKMNKINDDKSAGTTVKKNILVGEYQPRYYDLQINFDENNRVNYIGIMQIP